MAPGATPTRPAVRADPEAAVVSHRALLDRLLHGRAWIAIVAFALIGIVTMQLGLLKLNAGIGRALEHEGALQRENSALSVENSEAAAGDLVELRAAHLGMQLIPEGTLRFLAAPSGSGGEAGVLARAVRALNTPVSAPAASGGEGEAAAPTTSEPTAPATSEPTAPATSEPTAPATSEAATPESPQESPQG